MAVHSLQYLCTATSGIPGFPGFVAVGMLDGEPFCSYDNKIGRDIPRQEWAKEAVDPGYWQRNTQISHRAQRSFKDIAVAMELLNQTGAIHTFQNMYGCNWNEETGNTEAYDKYGYDGEDFLTFDLETMSWIPSVPQAFKTKSKWESNRAQTEGRKKYLTEVCIDWLKTYVNSERNTLEKKGPPEVTLLQKDPSSPVTCHATGFYPRGMSISWQRDGEDLHEDVELGDTLPNGDGTFQIRSSLRLSAEDMKMHSYTCTVQHSSLQQDVVKVLNEDLENVPLIGVIICVVMAVLMSSIAVIGFTVWKGKSGEPYWRKKNTSSSL
ncbi:class I histocompatibility antigen, F10 alpha chain-like [Megalops cyprinoides]|uniref:class I histocompatibility antigen, F10 alpha chain-like n=1 Tax=Megalops cyprinoides TaxID=118141 RepID=UPI001864F413|nr:class I histocompatibility antigen, F10 alpha chain-like [Megalops cyprinoides]